MHMYMYAAVYGACVTCWYIFAGALIGIGEIIVIVVVVGRPFPVLRFRLSKNSVLSLFGLFCRLPCLLLFIFCSFLILCFLFLRRQPCRLLPLVGLCLCLSSGYFSPPCTVEEGTNSGGRRYQK